MNLLSNTAHRSPRSPAEDVISTAGSSDPVPFAIPSIGQSEIDAVVDVLKSGWLTTGEQTREFEREFAAAVDAEHALAVNSATAGLHLALEAFGVGPGDRVLVPTFTFTATAEVVRYLGADPVLVDIDPHSLNLDLHQVQRQLATSRVKAILPVHFAGQACDMSALMDLARAHGTVVVEDAAHAFPATSHGRTVGSIGDATVFSFYATKTITTGEGGMVTTSSPAAAERIRTMRLHGISRDVFDRYRTPSASWQYDVVAPGFKYNMTDMAAAIGRAQLQRAGEFQARRAEIAERYSTRLGDLPIQLPVAQRPLDMHAWHLFVVQLRDDAGISRDQCLAELAELGIGTSVHFTPLHRLSYWRDSLRVDAGQFPVADRVFERVFSLPIYPAMTDQQVERVIRAVRQVLGG